VAARWFTAFCGRADGSIPETRFAGGSLEETLLYRRRRIGALALWAGVAALSVPGALFAIPITGTVNISGGVAVGATSIDFQPPVGGTNGNFAVSTGGNTGSFAGLTNATSGADIGFGGSILDLNVMTQTPGLPFAPLTGFITFFNTDSSINPAIRLDLTSIDPGVYSSTSCFVGATVPQNCTPPGFANGAANPFNLTNLGGGTSQASITFRGNAVNPGTGETTAFVGVFTTQFAVPYQQLLTTIQSGGVIGTSYSATISATSAVPEPGTFALLGLSLIGLGWGARRRRV
jgi:hypothetical protein